MLTTVVRTLDRIATVARAVDGLWARDVCAGDWVIVRTKNSVYSLSATGDGRFTVFGGWFAAQGEEGLPVRITGCTWGGRAILTGLVAAPGMFIEFDNGVSTTRVRDVRLIQNGAKPTVH
jgi:hypothetical protein